MSGTLFIVATPIGNLEDITARALRTLREVAVIAAEDTRRTAHLLARYAITTPTTSLHEHNETRKTPALIARLQAGDSIALVSDAGTPLVSDPGQHLIGTAIDSGIRVESIPGPSAIVTALAASGFDTQPFLFLGFPPTRSTDRKRWFGRLAAADATVVFFESPHRVRQTLEEIRAQVGDIQIVLAREMTKVHENLVRGPISVVLMSSNIATGEATIVADIGHKPDLSAFRDDSDEATAVEIGRLTDSGRMTKRQAIQSLARRHGRRPNDVYEAVERAKKLGKQQN
jgi:16S rRNA (cytidine1402-2'-O)-methyltransferase